MNLTKVEIQNLEQLEKYENFDFLVENKTLEEGNTFGELAIINNNQRAATISCMTDCHFASMTAKTYN